MKPLTEQELRALPVGSKLTVEHRDGNTYRAKKMHDGLMSFYVADVMPDRNDFKCKRHACYDLLWPGNLVYLEGLSLWHSYDPQDENTWPEEGRETIVKFEHKGELLTGIAIREGDAMFGYEDSDCRILAWMYPPLY